MHVNKYLAAGFREGDFLQWPTGQIFRMTARGQPMAVCIAHDCEKQAQSSQQGITYLFCRRHEKGLLPDEVAFYAAFKTQIRMNDREIAMLRRVSREIARQRNEIRMQFNVRNN